MIIDPIIKHFDDLSIAMMKLAGAMNKFSCSVNESKRIMATLKKAPPHDRQHPFKKFML